MRFRHKKEKVIEPILEWEKINDASALVLIREILDNVEDDALLERNGEALEKKYRQITGFVTDLIFYSAIYDEVEILQELKKDNVIYL
jgi:hypothetical protein